MPAPVMPPPMTTRSSSWVATSFNAWLRVRKENSFSMANLLCGMARLVGERARRFFNRMVSR